MSKTKKTQKEKQPKNYWERLAKSGGMKLEEYHLNRIEERLERNRLWGERLVLVIGMPHVNDIMEQAEDILTAAEALHEAFYTEQNKIVLGSYLTTLHKAIKAINEEIQDLEGDAESMYFDQKFKDNYSDYVYNADEDGE
jgi:hypothetical protein